MRAQAECGLHAVCLWVAGGCAQVRGEEEKLVGHQPAVNLGKTMSLHTLAEYGKGLGNRGVRLMFHGDTCPKTGQPRIMNITLVCSPKSGMGTANCLASPPSLRT